MAILIQINMVAEFPDSLIYEFGPVEEIIGRVSLNKSDGQVELFDMVPGAKNCIDSYLSRVAIVLARHHASGEYPERTDYRA